MKGKEFLKKSGLIYEVLDINEDKKALQDFTNMGLQGVPAFKVGDQVIVGLDIDKILNAVDYEVISCPSCKNRMRGPKNKGNVRLTCPHCRYQFIKNTGKKRL